MKSQQSYNLHYISKVKPRPYYSSRYRRSLRNQTPYVEAFSILLNLTLSLYASNLLSITLSSVEKSSCFPRIYKLNSSFIASCKHGQNSSGGINFSKVVKPSGLCQHLPLLTNLFSYGYQSYHLIGSLNQVSSQRQHLSNLS